jgi:hypothetical protein
MKLNLSMNEIEDQGARQLAHSLKSNQVSYIPLSFNYMFLVATDSGRSEPC